MPTICDYYNIKYLSCVNYIPATTCIDPVTVNMLFLKMLWMQQLKKLEMTVTDIIVKPVELRHELYLLQKNL